MVNSTQLRGGAAGGLVLSRHAVLWISFLVVLAGGVGVRAQASQPEYKIKAGFIYNFAKFVEWPANALPTNRPAPIVLGVLGSNPFNNYLDRIAGYPPVNAHSFVIKYCKSANDARECHILFISKPEARRLDAVLDELRGQSVLTVGESPGFAQGGGIIQFIEKQGKVRFYINQTAARAAGLKISSQLLKLATAVY